MTENTERTSEESAYFESGGEVMPSPVPEPEAKGAPSEPEIDFGDDTAKPAATPDDKPKVVPHQALHQERLRRQEVERQLGEQRAQYARFEERMKELNDALKPKPVIPDPMQDPIAALQYTQQELQTLRQQQEQARQQQDQQRQQQEHETQRQSAIRQIDDAYKTAWNAKASENPDTMNAYKSFVTALDGHFKLRGVTDNAQRQALIMDEERAIALGALQQGIDPAEAIIQQAALYGYRPAAPEVRPDTTIESKQKGLAAARSLSSAGGQSGDNSLTPERIANMSIEEYSALRAKLSPAKLARVLGNA